MRQINGHQADYADRDVALGYRQSGLRYRPRRARDAASAERSPA